MKLGMLHFFENPAGKSELDIIHEQTELMLAAEDLGFDSVWPAEHHFSEYGWCASPQLSLAAIATRTSRIRLGTGILVLPFHNPIRVAEDLAFLDLLSHGRVEFGVGRGYQPLEYQGFNLDQTQSRDMFDEALRLIVECWSRERVTFKGKYWQVDDVEVRPKPLQRPHPPIHMACISPDTFELAGRSGHHLLMGFAFGLTYNGARKGIEAWRAGRRAAGLDPRGGRKTCLMMVYPGRSMEAARQEFREPVNWYYRTIARFIAPEQGYVKSYEYFARSREFVRTLEFDDIVDTPAVVCGDVEHCVEKLSRAATEFGFDELLCWTRIGGLSPAKVRQAMELLSGEVLPRVRKQVAAAVVSV